MSDQATIAGKCIDAALAIILEKESELAKLDSVAGDGDHGAGMARGFRAAVEAERPDDAATVIVNAGNAFAAAAGGASGALVGMCIMSIGNGLKGGEIDAKKVHTGLTMGLQAIKNLGKSDLGDKTMIDTLQPFTEAYGEAAEAGDNIVAAWKKALPAGEAGMKSTAEMSAKRGRSAVLKERSVGTQDPGATSIFYVLEAVGKILEEECPV